ncbi:MAG: pyridoxal-dependent decarboxylase [Armatimonadota bacterium]|nr:pyridoxal-dependent decarboxylase [Armatimonadota bacterium]MDR7426090.1 pyridoxal-dependent decarboxylase [Armatimonadota bacterium]MDR7464354.1 pyridoxal-dependent decarboxylase [Armatimonadota bacterium]MDR7469089.1 pyridoxal-dependent decarboxylase [Armatimonadota bacterium]MDR7474291.1 pyridoxal-dependent decarboxylase [Armatimonadota bacterium]
MSATAPAADMHPEEFRHFGHRAVDWIADYLAHPERYPVLARTAPGWLRRALPASPPEHGEPMDAILADFERHVVPGLTHWNHPAFFAYFAITGSAPGILGELLAAALNVNAMLWKTSPAATELEEVTLDWLRQLVGLPPQFGIIMDTASVASLCAVAAAREAVEEYPVRQEGLAGGPRLRLYASEQAHSSIEKAAIILGLGQQGVRKIPTDPAFRLDAGALAQAIQEDRAAGWRPFCVVATVGTTSTTSVDPVPAIAETCAREGLWLHVDAAYAGMAAIVPEFRWVLDGCARADSVVINPHKWLFTPIDCSALFCRRPDLLRRAFSLVPEYLRTAEAEQAGVRDFMDYGVQLGRRFRALKLWMVIRYFGREGLVARLRQHIRLGQTFAAWVDAHPDFERMAPAPLSVVCFRARPSDLKGSADEREAYLDALNTALLDAVNATGRAYLSHTRLGGRFTLRLAVGNLRTTETHVRLAWELLVEHAQRLHAARRGRVEETAPTSGKE